MKIKDFLIMSVIIAVVILAAVGITMWLGQGSTGTDNEVVTGNSGAGVPDDGTSTLTITVYNALNTTASESRDQTVNFYKVSDSGEAYSTQVTDTTAGTKDLIVGQTYRARLVSASGEGAMITSVRTGEGAVLADDGSYVEFTPSLATYELELNSKKVSGLVARAYDVQNSAYMYDSADAETATYEATGTTFTSTVGNTTALAIGAGEAMKLRLDLKAATTYADAADFGMYILLDADVSKYDTPSVKFDGNRLSEVTLAGPESKAYSSYEYAFKVNAPFDKESTKALVPYNSDRALELEMSALAGVNPGASDDVVIAFAPIGQVSEVSSNVMRVSSVNDAPSPAAVQTLQTFTADIS